MPINEENGKAVFDPSKRVKRAIGEKTAENINAEVLQKITEEAVIMSESHNVESSAVRNTVTDRNENTSEKNEFMNNIIHTNPAKPVNTAAVEERFNAFNGTIHKMFAVENKSLINKVSSFVTGYTKSAPKNVKMVNTVNNVVGVISGAIETSMMDNTFYSNASRNTAIKSAGIIAALDFGNALMTSVNNDYIASLYDGNQITQVEAKAIGNVKRAETIKYAAEHTLASVVVPVVAKMAIDKIVPETLKSNNVIKAVSSFGTLSTIGKATLQISRCIVDNKLERKIKESVYEPSVDMSENYKSITTLAVRKTIDGKLDNTVISGVVGSITAFVQANVQPKKAFPIKTVEALPTKLATEVKVAPKTKKLA